MLVLLAIVAGLALVAMVWWGTRTQTLAVKAGARGAGLVVAGTLLTAALLMVTDPGDNLAITEASLSTSPGGDRSVAGTVENRTDRRMAPVRLEIEFIDSQSRIVDRLGVEAAKIEARGKWEFRQPVESEAAVGFRARVGSPDNVRPAWLGGGCGSELCRKDQRRRSED